jgi:hypothetical protein
MPDRDRGPPGPPCRGWLALLTSGPCPHRKSHHPRVRLAVDFQVTAEPQVLWSRLCNRCSRCDRCPTDPLDSRPAPQQAHPATSVSHSLVCWHHFPLSTHPNPTVPSPPDRRRSEACARWHFVHLSFFLFLYNLFIDFPACVYSYSDRHRPRTDGTNYTIIPARLRCCVAVCASCPVPAPVLVPFVDNPPNREIAVATAVRLELQPPASIVCSHHQDICRRTQPSRKDCSRPSERAPTALACLRRAGSRPFIPAPDRIANPSPSLLPPTPTYPADSPTGTTSHHDGSPSPRIASPPALVAMSTTN